MAYEFIDVTNLEQRAKVRLGEPRLTFVHHREIKIGLFTSPPDPTDINNLPPNTWIDLYVAKDYDDAAEWMRTVTIGEIRKLEEANRVPG